MYADLLLVASTAVWILCCAESCPVFDPSSVHSQRSKEGCALFPRKPLPRGPWGLTLGWASRGPALAAGRDAAGGCMAADGRHPVCAPETCWRRLGSCLLIPLGPGPASGTRSLTEAEARRQARGGLLSAPHQAPAVPRRAVPPSCAWGAATLSPRGSWADAPGSPSPTHRRASGSALR